MATLSIGEARWRMLRRLLGLPPPATFVQVRNWCRHDRKYVEDLIAWGLVRGSVDTTLAVTEKGKEVAHLGEMEMTWDRDRGGFVAAVPSPRPRAKTKKGR